MMNQNNQQLLAITQIVTKNNVGYLFLYPFGAKYEDIYEALKELESQNRANEATQKEQQEEQKRKAAQEVQDGVAEAEAL